MITFELIKKHRVKWIISGVFLLFLCSIVFFKEIANFPIRTVNVEGSYPHVDKALLTKALLPYVKKRFFDVDMVDIKNVIESDPWVKKTMVWRIWPSTLVIYITEKKPVAIWNGKGLMTAQGTYFEVTNLPSHLPELFGDDSDRDTVFKNFMAFSQLLNPIQLSLDSVSLDGRHSWQLVLQNGSKLILGNQNATQRLTEFVKVYPKVFKNKMNRLDYADLRYVNGMAVKWKKNS